MKCPLVAVNGKRGLRPFGMVMNGKGGGLRNVWHHKLNQHLNAAQVNLTPKCLEVTNHMSMQQLLTLPKKQNNLDEVPTGGGTAIFLQWPETQWSSSIQVTSCSLWWRLFRFTRLTRRLTRRLMHSTVDVNDDFQPSHPNWHIVEGRIICGHDYENMLHSKEIMRVGENDYTIISFNHALLHSIKHEGSYDTDAESDTSKV